MLNCDVSRLPGKQCAMGEKEQSTGELHFVGKRDELVEAKRSFRTLEGRDILIIYHQGGFYAMDSYCYREYTSSNVEIKTAAFFIAD